MILLFVMSKSKSKRIIMEREMRERNDRDILLFQGHRKGVGNLFLTLIAES